MPHLVLAHSGFVECDPGRVFHVRVVEGPPVDGRWEFAPTPSGGTRVTLTPLAHRSGRARVANRAMEEMTALVFTASTGGSSGRWSRAARSTPRVRGACSFPHATQQHRGRGDEGQSVETGHIRPAGGDARFRAHSNSEGVLCTSRRDLRRPTSCLRQYDNRSDCELVRYGRCGLTRGQATLAPMRLTVAALVWCAL